MFMPKKPKTHTPHGTPTTAQKCKQYEKVRGTASQRGYTYKWSKAAKGFLKKNPLCVMCLEEGHTCAATEVDHIVPHHGDQKLFWDKSNWQGLCKSHHSQKTATENRHRPI